jgi:hypothetical protein
LPQKRQVQHKQYTTAIISIIGAVVTIISINVTLSFNQAHPTQSPSTQNTFPTLIVAIFLVILILMAIINSVVQYRNTKRYDIIRTLSGLQNKYILNAEFKTSKEHGELSKEKELTNGGNARILTNSLNYDFFYCDSIADNLIKGAKYTYVIPYKSSGFTDLQNYITKLHNELYNKNSHSNNDPAGNEETVKNILKNKVEFWFFEVDILCLYNFARFTQIGNPHFVQQSWWYLNPKDHNDNSYMLSQEINEPGDHEQLNEVFEVLKQNSRIKNAYVVYENRDNIPSFLGEE